MGATTGATSVQNCEPPAMKAAKAPWASCARSESGRMLVIVTASPSSRENAVQIKREVSAVSLARSQMEWGGAGDGLKVLAVGGERTQAATRCSIAGTPEGDGGG